MLPLQELGHIASRNINPKFHVQLVQRLFAYTPNIGKQTNVLNDGRNFMALKHTIQFHNCDNAIEHVREYFCCLSIFANQDIAISEKENDVQCESTANRDINGSHTLLIEYVALLAL